MVANRLATLDTANIPMTESDHDLVVKLARQVKMPRYMYDTPAAREALNRFIQAVALERSSSSNYPHGS